MIVGRPPAPRTVRIMRPGSQITGLGAKKNENGLTAKEQAAWDEQIALQKARDAANAALLAEALAKSAAKSGNTQLSQQFTQTQQQLIQKSETLAASTSNPTAAQAAVTANNEFVQAQIRLAQARGVVNTYTAAFNDTVESIVKPDLYPQGTQLFKAEPETWVMLQYPSAMRPCNLANLQIAGARPDLYNRAQDALAQLVQVAPYWPDLQAPVGSAIRDYASRLAADWFTCVYGWVSLGFFATNVQPRFLLPDAPTTEIFDDKGVPGAIAPNRFGSGTLIPAELITAINELKGGANTVPGVNAVTTAKAVDELALGPMWMGFWDKGEASGWTTATFSPQYDAFWKDGYKYDRLRPLNFDEGKTVNVNTKTIAKDMQNPWYFWYYMFMHATPANGSVFAFTYINEKDITGRNTNEGTMPVPGTMTSVQMALGWSQLILKKAIVEHIEDALTWYTTNHVPYWVARGLVDGTIDEARAYQRAAASAVTEARAQAAQRTITAVGGAAMAVAAANPVSLAVVAAAVVLAKGITALFSWRRKKKAKKKADLMQPLVFRTLAESPCTAFSKDMTLPATLQSALANMTLELSDTPSDSTRVVTVPSAVPAQDGTVQQTQQIVAVTTSNVALASNPLVLPAVVGSGDAITTSTSSAQPTSSTPQPMPSAGQVTEAIVQAQTAPLPSALPSTGVSTWIWVAGGGLALLGGLLLLRKK